MIGAVLAIVIHSFASLTGLGGRGQYGRSRRQRTIVALRAGAIAGHPAFIAVNIDMTATRAVPDVVVDGFEELFQLLATIEMIVIGFFPGPDHDRAALRTGARPVA